jgi:plastocyanin
VRLGAIGFIVIHNAADPDDVIIADGDTANLPGGSRNGSPIIPSILHFGNKLAMATDSLARIGPMIDLRHPPGPDPEPKPDPMPMSGNHGKPAKAAKKIAPADTNLEHIAEHLPLSALGQNQAAFAIDKGQIIGLLFPHYRTPPAKAQYLLLFHDMTGVGFCINGRVFLGNTPTLFSGPNTVMRFGVVGMGDMFHTFHLHGHRWTIPGPDGNNRNAIQNSPQVTAVSQFEDTRIFGPANSFNFTIHQGSGQFMGANPDSQPVPGSAAQMPGSIGEWHMHCHVLSHMETGMMGSLLIRQGGEIAGALPHGQACPDPPTGPTTGVTHTINIGAIAAAPFFAFQPAALTIAPGDSIVWHNLSTQPHTASQDGGGFDTTTISAGATSSPPIVFPTMGTFHYHCNIHTDMHGIITVM